MADTDLLTIDEAQTLLGVTGDTDLSLIKTYISTASDVIVGKCGPVIREAGQDDFPITEYFDGDGRSATVRVQRPPIFEVAMVLELRGDTITAADNWTVYPAAGRVVRRNADNTADLPFSIGRQNVSVSYHPGRVESVEEVPARFKQACFMIVDRLWKLYQASGSSTYGTDAWVPARAVPPMVDEILADELLPPAVA